MTTFVLPVIPVPHLYRETMPAAIARLSTPLSDARPDDVLGVIARFSRETDHASLNTHFDFLVMSEAATLQAEPYSRLPATIRPAAADIIATICDSGLHWSTYCAMIGQLCPDRDWAREFEMLLLPEMVILTVDEYESNIIEGLYEDSPLSQQIVSEIILAGMVSPPTSAHELCSKFHHCTDALKIVRQIYPIIDSNGTEHSLTLPPMGGTILPSRAG